MSDEVAQKHVHIGEVVFADTPTNLLTTLGSCVSVCIFANDHSVGGMTHFSLPAPMGLVPDNERLRYAEMAIDYLVQNVKKISGQTSPFFSAKVVGGAQAIGAENVKMAMQVLKKHGITVVGQSVGGEVGRKVIFQVHTGRLFVAKLSGNIQERKRRVLIVDDSKTIRDLLKRILSVDPEIEIVGQAADAFEADRMVVKFKPDVITLDIHMPRMSGVEWLEKLLAKKPIPVVMISSMQLKEGNEVFRALELGAVDYIQKPSFADLATVGPVIQEKIKSASHAKVIRHVTVKTKPISRGPVDTSILLAIGASTGGTEALKNVLSSLPSVIPPTVIVQHIPPVFSRAFAERMNQVCSFEVKEAEDGDELKPSLVLIAPGGRQMKIERFARGHRIRITDDPPVNRHKPSVDYLFQSVAELMGKKAIGVILTGMGNDGAKGLLAMRKKGCYTIGQDEATSVVYGMPRVAFEVGAVETQAPLQDIPSLILSHLAIKKTA